MRAIAKAMQGTLKKRITPLKVTVCELPNGPDGLDRQWERLASHTQSAGSDLVLLPEMPFHRWLAASNRVISEQWQHSVNTHRRWISRLPELGAATVMGTRPIIHNGAAYNQGFLWSKKDGRSTPAHTKYYLPDETGFWEASWYRPGEATFETISCHDAVIGFLICTELWFTQHARAYGRQGANIIVCPRVTPAAVVSGAYCLSSNLSGPNVAGVDFGGTGWIIEPEEGAVLGTTSSHEPFLTMDIDLGWAEAAKSTYPRYVAD